MAKRLLILPKSMVCFFNWGEVMKIFLIVLVAQFYIMTIAHAEDQCENLKKIDPIATLVKYGCLELVKSAVKDGADVNEFTKDVGSPLMLAIEETKRIDILNEIIKAGANMNRVFYKSGAAYTPLFAAIDSGDIDILKTVISAGANINYVNDVDTPLCHAIRNANLSFIKEIIANGANVNTACGEETPYSLAKTDEVQNAILFADINAKLPNGKNLLSTAEIQNDSHISFCVDLINRGINVCEGNYNTLGNIYYRQKSPQYDKTKLTKDKSDLLNLLVSNPEVFKEDCQSYQARKSSAGISKPSSGVNKSSK
jgi:ankyrin repeat protein